MRTAADWILNQRGTRICRRPRHLPLDRRPGNRRDRTENGTRRAVHAPRQSRHRQERLIRGDAARPRGVDYDRLVLLQPTSPMRTADDVRRALELYTPDIDMVVTVKEAESNPYYNCFEEGDDGFLQISKGDGTFTRRQDAPKAWEYNGAVYVINTTSLRQMPLGKFKRRRMCPMDAARSIDLDTPLDWLIAEHLMKERNIQASL